MNKNTTGYIALILILAVAGFVSLGLFFRQRTENDLLDVRTFPLVMDDWKGGELEITERDYNVLETKNLILREYLNPMNEKIYLFIIYSETNRSVFHPPEVCLTGSGITIASKTSEKINMDGRNFFVNKIYTQKNNSKQLILYCYKAGDLYTDSYYLQQAYFAFNQLFGKNKGGATIRVSVPIAESEDAAIATLKGFLKKTVRTLEKLR